MLYAYKHLLKFSFKCIHPYYLFHCFKYGCWVCPNLSSAPCILCYVILYCINFNMQIQHLRTHDLWEAGFKNSALFEDYWTGWVLLAGRLKLMIKSWRTAEYDDYQLETWWVYLEDDSLNMMILTFGRPLNMMCLHCLEESCTWWSLLRGWLNKKLVS